MENLFKEEEITRLCKEARQAKLEYGDFEPLLIAAFANSEGKRETGIMHPPLFLPFSNRDILYGIGRKSHGCTDVIFVSDTRVTVVATDSVTGEAVTTKEEAILIVGMSIDKGWTVMLYDAYGYDDEDQPLFVGSKPVDLRERVAGGKDTAGVETYFSTLEAFFSGVRDGEREQAAAWN